MNKLEVIKEEKIFNYNVQVYGTFEEPLFLAKDVAAWIGLSNVTDMVSRIDEEEVTKLNLGGLQGECNFLTEDGLYEVLMQSRKSIAKQFKAEIKKMLKSVRKTGGHVSNTEMFVESYFGDLDPTSKSFILATLDSKKRLLEENKKQFEIIEEQKPKVEFFDSVAESKTAIGLGEVAKVLAIKGMGRNNLFEFLRQNKILMMNNQPYQSYIDRGFFRVIEQSYMKDGEVCINFKTLVYQKGLDFIRKQLENQK
ncbi:MAG: phage antirepressor Ant [Chloroflexi bacterium]|nr:phage antirepressor Ant [Chloroflexota bacterium]